MTAIRIIGNIDDIGGETQGGEGGLVGYRWAHALLDAGRRSMRVLLSQLKLALGRHTQGAPEEEEG